MAQDAESIARTLLPGGKLVGREWCCGSISGDEGNSLKVNCGSKSGTWKDFADNSKGGDLIDLVQAVKGCSKAEAIAWGRDWCGIKDDKHEFLNTRKEMKPIAPLKSTNNSKAVIDWFGERGIFLPTLERFKIVSQGSVVAFPCYVGNDLMHTKYRDILKPKKEAFSTSKDSTPILFGWQAVQNDARRLIIAEGECDAMCYAQSGFNAVSVPMGAGTGNKQQWLDFDYDRLEQFDEIYLSMDMDKAGQETIPHIANRIGLHRCKIIKLPCKDANECILTGIGLAKYVNEAKTIDPDELHHSGDYISEVEELFRPTKEGAGGIELPWRSMDQKFKVRRGELTVWTGFNGSGKSMVLSQVMGHLISKGERVCIASMEMAPPVTLKRMFQQIGAVETPTKEYLLAMNEWLADNLWIVAIRGTAKADRLIDVCRYAWKRYGVTQIVIDSLLKCGFEEDDYNGQKQFVDKLCDFTVETQCHVHLVSHARKMEDELKLPGKMDVRGGSALTDLPDNVIAVWRNKMKEQKIDEARRINPVADIPAELSHSFDAVIQVHKQRHHDWEGKLALWFDRSSHVYADKQGARAMPYV
jgi:twinkle protein